MIRRLFVVLALVLGAVGPASAVITPGYDYKAGDCPWGEPMTPTWVSSPAAACAQLGDACAKRQGSELNRMVHVGSDPGYCAVQNDAGGTLASVTISARTAGCPANSLLVETTPPVCHCYAGFEEKDGQCRPVNPCPAGQHEEGGLCVPDNCSPNQVRVNGLCVDDPDNCPDGKKKVNGKCDDACPKRGTLAGEFQVASESPTSFCENKCTVSISSFVRAIKDGKVVSIVGMGYYTGGSCNGPGYTPPKDDKPQTPGEEPGEGEPGNGGEPGNPGGGNPGGGNPGGGGDPGGQPNPGGGSNHDSNPPPADKPNKCPGGNCTGTESGQNVPGGTDPPGGGDGDCPPGTYKSGGKCYAIEPPTSSPDNDGKCPPGTIKVGGVCVPYQPTPDDEKQELDDFCKKQPDSIICKQSTFSGACRSGFQCEGDAMICAIAREQHTTNCKLLDTENVDKDYKSAVDGSDPKSADKLRETATPVSVGSLDSTGLGWSRGCPPDPSFDLRGMSFTIPFSKVCGPLGVLSYAAVGLTLLGCLLWVVGKVD